MGGADPLWLPPSTVQHYTVQACHYLPAHVNKRCTLLCTVVCCLQATLHCIVTSIRCCTYVTSCLLFRPVAGTQLMHRNQGLSFTPEDLSFTPVAHLVTHVYTYQPNICFVALPGSQQEPQKKSKAVMHKPAVSHHCTCLQTNTVTFARAEQ